MAMFQVKRFRGLSDQQFALVLVMPAVILCFVVIVIPILYNVYLSFTAYQIVDPERGFAFVGLKNYARVLRRTDFLSSFGKAMIFSVGATLLEFILGFAAALLLNSQIRLRELFRGILVIPWVMPTVVVAYLWLWVLNGQFGILNWLLVQIGVLSEFFNWLSDPISAFAGVIFINSWKTFPFHMVILLAALQTIPEELLEAANIDGASAIQRFWRITLPLMRYVILALLMFRFILNLRNFDIIFMTTEGGPGIATLTMPLWIYRVGFLEWDTSMAAAIAVLWAIVMAIVAGLVMRFGRLAGED